VAVTVAQLEAALAGTLHLADGAAGLQEFWHALTPTALQQAVADVSAALAARGFSSSQATLWPGWEPTVTLQALYWCLVLGWGSLPEPPSRAEIDALDQRPRLRGEAGLAPQGLTDAGGQRASPAAPADVAGHGVISGSFRDAQAKDPAGRDASRLSWLDSAGRVKPW
jgi:hypothetical protein